MMTNAPAKQLWRDVPVPKTPVTVYEALHHRRMAWKFQDRPVPHEALERMLATAVWAPNHRLTEPWRFVVLEKDTPLRRRVADLAHQGVLEADPRRATAYRAKITDPPVLIYAYSVRGPNEEATRENYAAVVCALHNVGLAGVAEGIAVTWETGGVTRVPGLGDALGAAADWDMVAMASAGYPDEPSNSARTPATHFVRWA